jgi:hypothetical protein
MYWSFVLIASFLVRMVLAAASPTLPTLVDPCPLRSDCGSDYLYSIHFMNTSILLEDDEYKNNTHQVPQ